MIEQITNALEARELMKISVLQNCEEDRDVVAQKLVTGSRSELVQVIGKTIVLYKESKENKKIELPR